MIRGSLDVVTPTEARGWAFSSIPNEPLLVQAVLNQEIIGEALAENHRPDLAAAGLGDGNSGYIINFFRQIDPLYLPFISVKVNGGDAELPRAPQLGFVDFITSFHRATPSAGRHRSLLGGLWTDRTDASAVLRGKVQIGQVDGRMSAVLDQLINHGFAVLSLETAPYTGAWLASLQTAALELTQDEALAPLLRAVFSDVPLVAQAEWVELGEAPLAQPSVRNASPSVAECLDIVVPLDGGVKLDVVRESYKLPEFTPNGTSRWSDPEARVIDAHHFLDSYVVEVGTVAIIGAGTIYAPRCKSETSAVRILTVPERGRGALAA